MLKIENVVLHYAELITGGENDQRRNSTVANGYSISFPELQSAGQDNGS